jgi:hypothetical protein
MRLVYPHLGKDAESGRDRQEARVLTITVDEAGIPRDLGVRRIVAASPIDSVLHMTFVEPERPARNPSDPLDSSAVLTWLETESHGTEVKIHQRAQVAVGSAWSSTYELTVEAGQPSPWAPVLECGTPPGGKRECWLGDYHYGAFVDKTNGGRSLRLLVAWPETDPLIAGSTDAGVPTLRAHASLVTITDLTP